MDPNDRDRNGGKFPNRDKGMALEEFVNEPESSNRMSATRPPGSVADFEQHRRARASQEKIPIGIVGAVGIAALAVVSGALFFLTRSRKSKPAPPRTDDTDDV
jgi:hypothetical protein